METKKIKSKWRAQKRKEGLVPQKTPEDVPSGDEPAGEAEDEWHGFADNADDREASGSDDDATESTSDSDEEATASDAESVHSEPPPKRQRSNPRGRGARGRGGTPGQTSDRPQQQSLRDLNNLAYSRSSLHTYKSRGARGHDSARGRGRGSFQQRGRGRGQPDMRLRMNAMLEKIKRDLV